MTTEKMTIQNKERTYLVYLPTNYVTTKTYPLVFMFHGLGGTAAGAAGDSYGITQLADQKEFIAVFPESLTIPPKDFKLLWYSYPAYDLPKGYTSTKRWDIAHIQASNRCASQDLDFVKSMITTIGSKYKISADHVYFVGHSYGALFSYYASMCMPDKVTAFASHSGGLVKYFIYTFPINAVDARKNASLQVPGLLISSTDDPVMPYSWTTALQKELTSKGHTNQLITLTGMGHNWDKSRDEAIWNYFVANSKPLPA